MVWHLDVGLSFPKSVVSLLVGVLIPQEGRWGGRIDVTPPGCSSVISKGSAGAGGRG